MRLAVKQSKTKTIMGWMKEVWRLMRDQELSYDEAIDIVANERREREIQQQEYERRANYTEE